MRKTRAALIPFLVGLSACPEPARPTPPPQDGGAAITCAIMCGHIRDELQCHPEGDKTPRGATCEQVCENYQASGFAYRDLSCEGTAATCEAVRACSR